MRFTAAVTKEQGVTFTVYLVKSGVIASSNRERVRTSAPSNLPRPIVLAPAEERNITEEQISLNF